MEWEVPLMAGNHSTDYLINGGGRRSDPALGIGGRTVRRMGRNTKERRRE
jgi:hypothetical protein